VASGIGSSLCSRMKSMAGWSPLLFVARRAPKISFSFRSSDSQLNIHSILAGSNPIEMRTSLSDIVAAWCRDGALMSLAPGVKLTRLVDGHA
jgi:hypothetical protein